MNTSPLHRIVRNFRWIWLLAVLASIHTGCQRQTDTSTSTLARVGPDVITEARYRAWWNEHRPREDTSAVRQACLEKLVERSSLAQAAREVGLDRDPVVLEQIDNLLIGRLKEMQLQPQLTAVGISEDQLHAAYESSPKSSVPERVRVAVLWYDTRGQAPLVARYRPRLEAARASAAPLPASDGFGRLALNNTEHRSSRFKGGDLGWLDQSPTADPWKSEVLRIAGTLQEPGELSEVVATGEGLFLVRLIDRLAARVKPFAEVRQGIERRLLARQRQEVEEAFRQQMLARVPVQSFPDRLDALRDLPLARDHEFSPQSFQVRAK